MVINGRRRQFRMLKQDVDVDRNILLFASVTLGVVVMALTLWFSTP